MYIVGGLAELRTKFVDETCEQAVYDAVDAWKKSAPAGLTNSQHGESLQHELSDKTLI